MENNQHLPKPHVEVFGGEFNRKSDRKSCCHRRGNGVTGGLLILAAGIILLLNNLGTIPWTFWDYVAPFWPVLLILLGLKIVLGYNIISRVVLVIISVFIIWAVIVYGLAQSGVLLPANIHPNISDFNNFYLIK